MKKFLALLLALVMSLSLVACGGGDDTAADGGADAEDGGNAETAAYQVAMITDYGDITDQSFNQTTYEACQEFCDAEGLQFEYYKPAGDSTAERVAMVDAAVADGYNVIVMPGYAFAETIKETAELYPEPSSRWTWRRAIWARTTPCPPTCTALCIRKSCAATWPATPP